MNQPSHQAIIETIRELYPDANITEGYASAIWAKCGGYGLMEFERALLRTREDNLTAKKPDFDALLRHLNSAHREAAGETPDNPFDKVLAVTRDVSPIREDLDDSALYAEHERDVEASMREILGPAPSPGAKAAVSAIIADRQAFGRKLWRLACELYGREIPECLRDDTRESRTEAADNPGAASGTEAGRRPQRSER